MHICVTFDAHLCYIRCTFVLPSMHFCVTFDAHLCYLRITFLHNQCTLFKNEHWRYIGVTFDARLCYLRITFLHNQSTLFKNVHWRHICVTVAEHLEYKCTFKVCLKRHESATCKNKARTLSEHIFSCTFLEQIMHELITDVLWRCKFVHFISNLGTNKLRTTHIVGTQPCTIFVQWK